MEIRAVLWDADGVLQRGPSSTAPFDELLGEKADAFGAAVWGRLDEALTGRLHMAEHVESVLDDLGLHDRLDEVLALWDLIEPLPEPRALLASVRGAGTRCYLATNQDDLRAARMRHLMGYDDLLDGSYYSCELGVAKPAGEYFLAMADDLDLPREQLLFVDDNVDNVEGARDAGLWTILWRYEDGMPALLRRLAVHGVRSG